MIGLPTYQDVGPTPARADQLKTDQPLARTSDNDDHWLFTGPKCVRVNMPAEMNFGESSTQAR